MRIHFINLVSFRLSLSEIKCQKDSIRGQRSSQRTTLADTIWEEIYGSSLQTKHILKSFLFLFCLKPFAKYSRWEGGDKAFCNIIIIGIITIVGI